MSGVDATGLRSAVESWAKLHARAGRLSRNTIAAGLVVLDTIAKRGRVSESEAFTTGGELAGARSGLSGVLTRSGIDARYLKEVTTRQAASDARSLYVALNYGTGLDSLTEEQRRALLAPAFDFLRVEAQVWLNSRRLELQCDRQNSPAAWIEAVLEQGTKRSGGKVEQHLVGAKLERRFSAEKVPNQHGNAGDVQTGRAGDFALGRTVFHVTVAPSGKLFEKCRDNLAAGLKPVVIVPRDKVPSARTLAADKQLEKRVVTLALEEFIASNVIELAEGDDDRFLMVMQEIVEIYNRRLAEVETDLSLQIDLD